MPGPHMSGERRATAQSAQGTGGWQNYLTVDLEDDDEAGLWIDTIAEAGRRQKIHYEREWFLLIARYAGYHYLSFDREAGRLSVPDAPPWRVRLVVNRLVGYVRTIVAKLLKSRPIPVVQPATNDPEDVSRARTGEKVIRYQWDRQRMDELLEECLLWVLTCGSCALKVGWNDETGDLLDEADSLDAALAPGGGNGESFRSLEGAFESMAGQLSSILSVPKGSRRLGDVGTWVRSPFDIITPPEIIRFRDCPWQMELVTTPIPEAEDRFGVKGLMADADSRYGIGYFHDRIQRLVGPSAVGGDATYTDINSTYLKELWVAPSRKHPMGRHVIRAGGKTLLNEEFPPGVKRIPLVWFEEIKIPGRIWPTSTVEQLWPIQASYNRSRSQTVENQNLMSKPKWLVPQEAELGDESITAEPGEVIEYHYPHKPEMVQPPGEPAYVSNHQSTLVGEMDDVAGVRDISKAQAPTGLESGVALSLLQEADDTRLGPLSAMVGRGLSDVGRLILEIIADNYDEPRLVSVVGETGTHDVFSFMGKDLLGNRVDEPGANYFDVHFEMGSQLPTMRAARQQFVLQLLQYGLLRAEEESDRQFVLKLLDLNIPYLYESASFDRPMAEVENRSMAVGSARLPHTWENHAVHIQAHDEFRKRPEFERLPEEAKVLFERHVQGHRLLLTGAIGPDGQIIPGAGMGPEATPPVMPPLPASPVPTP